MIRVMTGVRLAAAVAVVVITGPVVACSSGSNSESSCGAGPVLRVPSGQTIHVASCAGEIGLAGPAPSVTLRVGQQATLASLGFGYSAPVSDNPQVVEVRTGGDSAVLRAVGSGDTTISLATDFCMGHRSDHCPAIRVTVHRG